VQEPVAVPSSRLKEADVETREEEPPPILSPALLKCMVLAANRLARNPELLFTVLGERPEISPEAVRARRWRAI
jgi:hypothetical protein